MREIKKTIDDLQEKREGASHEPSLIVIGTPTLGFEHQGSGDSLVTSRDKDGRPRTGIFRNLFDYMHEAGENGQIIVLNNTYLSTPQPPLFN